MRPAGGWRSRDTVVRAFETIPHGWADPTALASALRAWLGRGLRRRRARVAVWGVASTHRSFWLPAAEPADPALRAVIRDAALHGEVDVVSRTMEGAARAAADGSAGRDLAVTLASRADLADRTRPLIDAGLRIDAVTTPPMALCSVARLRRSRIPGESVALLSLGADATALAIVRDGFPLLAREMLWGYERAGARALDRDQLVSKIASELRRSLLFVKQTTRSEVSHVLMCGDAPELRALTAPLIAELDIEIETLDSLEGIATDPLPQPPETFREQVGRFRLAWALAADDGPLMTFDAPRVGVRRSAVRRTAGLAAGLSVAAALGGGASYRSVDRTARVNEERVAALAREIADLEPEIRRVERARADGDLASARRAALAAFDVQGPRLTRVLEALSQSTPQEITLDVLDFTASGTVWTAHLSGVASAGEPALARAAVDELLRGLQDSPYVDGPSEPPVLRLSTGIETGREVVPAGGPRDAAVAVAFSVNFTIPK